MAVVQRCDWLLYKHERLVTLVVLIRVNEDDDEKMSDFVAFLLKDIGWCDRNWKMWHHTDKHRSVVTLWHRPDLPNGHPECP